MSEVDFNVNGYIKIKLTEFGIEILKKQHEELQAIIPSIGDFKLKLDEEGYYESQMWSIMQDFSGYISMTSELPFSTNIKIILDK